MLRTSVSLIVFGFVVALAEPSSYNAYSNQKGVVSNQKGVVQSKRVDWVPQQAKVKKVKSKPKVKVLATRVFQSTSKSYEPELSSKEVTWVPQQPRKPVKKVKAVPTNSKKGYQPSSKKDYQPCEGKGCFPLATHRYLVANDRGVYSSRKFGTKKSKSPTPSKSYEPVVSKEVTWVAQQRKPAKKVKKVKTVATTSKKEYQTPSKKDYQPCEGKGCFPLATRRYLESTPYFNSNSYTSGPSKKSHKVKAKKMRPSKKFKGVLVSKDESPVQYSKGCVSKECFLRRLQGKGVTYSKGVRPVRSTPVRTKAGKKSGKKRSTVSSKTPVSTKFYEEASKGDSGKVVAAQQKGSRPNIKSKPAKSKGKKSRGAAPVVSSKVALPKGK